MPTPVPAPSPINRSHSFMEQADDIQAAQNLDQRQRRLMGLFSRLREVLYRGMGIFNYALLSLAATAARFFRASDPSTSEPSELAKCLLEMLAEGVGIFIYVLLSVGVKASQYFEAAAAKGPSALGETGSSDKGLLHLGLAAGSGMMFATLLCADVPGGHFNPAITISATLFGDFNTPRALRCIFAQLVGTFLAGLCVYGMWYERISAAIEGGTSREALIQIFCTVPKEDQALGYLFFLETMANAFLGFVIWALLDRANLMPLASIPFTIGLAHTMIVATIKGTAVTTNLARDLGMRLVAAIFLSPAAFTFQDRSWVGTIVTVPAMVFGAAYHQFLFKHVLRDLLAGGLSSRPTAGSSEGGLPDLPEDFSTFAGNRDTLDKLSLDRYPTE